MDFERAQQIVNSDRTIEVLLNGTPVWIEDLDPENRRAMVKPLDGTEKVIDVPVTELVEGRFM
ncbi:H-type small acid-soluble spore protein [Desulforudis sp. 1088]|jgi:H-type small acid-soluble spore protein|uniref:H-type small acid-soluble spore protein n=1 Tax=unclassified Candidatus Desulforudis TaxID=2635950 RepID=UPI0034960E70